MVPHSSESSDAVELELNILSFQRADSNVNFLINPNIGTNASTIRAQMKLTPRTTFCSTRTLIGIDWA